MVEAQQQAHQPLEVNLSFYLEATTAIDWRHSEVLAWARQLASEQVTVEAITQSCFEWVRDEIHHSFDYQMNPVTWRASDVMVRNRC